MPPTTGLCQQPLCYRTFKGARGLSIHLGQSKRCSDWYKTQALDRSPSPSQPPVDAVTSPVECIQSSPLPWSSNLRSHDAPLLGPRARQHKSVTVEEVVDDDFGGLGDVDAYSSDSNGAHSPSKSYTKLHPTAGKIYGKGRTFLQEIDDKDDAKTDRRTNVYYPFMSRQDFEMGAWLSESNVSRSQIEHFLKLEYVILFFIRGYTTDFLFQVKKHGGLSFRTAQELNTKLAMLPQPPAWKSRTVSVEGGTTKTPLVLFYREGLEVFKFLFGNPLFEQLQDYVPTKIWADYENDIRILDGPFTGDLTFEIQVGSINFDVNNY